MCAAIAQQPPAVYATAAYTDARKVAPIYLEEAEALQTMVGFKKIQNRALLLVWASIRSAPLRN